ncbi:MAG: hypothetical protein IJX37_08190 [Oscillospiraceae bacterium]|nr:hypothetical protein [Oscillospiraceae bacterium]
MEITPKKYYIGIRVCLAVVFVFLEFLFCIVLVAIVQENVMSVCITLLALLGQVVLVCFFVWLLSCKCWVAFTKEKIQVQLLFKTKEYLWKDLKQIGVLNKHQNGKDYPGFVILLPGGTPRKSYDMFFCIKNIGCLIHIPNTPLVRSYIADCYGPLDFDLSEGKPET